MSDDALEPSVPPSVTTATTVDAFGDRAKAVDPTRTSAPSSTTPEPPSGGARLPAPLQVRDPDRYQVVGEHGRGGLGRVLRARDKELGRDVAVKELLQRGTTSELRFFREALITARLEHPGIVPVHEAGRWPDGTPFYAMKLVQGRPLRELIDECKTLPARLALLPHVVAVADAVAYAHDRKIIHRDLKPSNVIVGAFGETVVIDWGLAKDLTSEIADPVEEGPYRTGAAAGVTVAGTVLGTPAYMAPEQHDGKADERADIYALGAMLLHVVTGRTPRCDDDGDLEIRGPSGSEIPKDVQAIIARATTRSPDARYRSAKDLAADLRRYAERRPVSARRYSFAARAVLGLARHRAVSVILFMALTALAVTLAVENRRVAGQRERARDSEAAAEHARGAAEQSLDDLTIKHAELLLTSDPSAALDALANYHGGAEDRANQIRAEAVGRGVALVRATPHADTIVWAEGTADGTIYSLSTDGTIAKTAPNGVSDVLARGVAQRGTNAYSPASHLLAYACDPDDLCLFDVAQSVELPRAQEMRGVHVGGLSFSPNGYLLATVTEDSVLKLFDVRDPLHPIERLRKPIDRADDVLFVDDDTLAVGTEPGIELRPVNGGPSQTFGFLHVSWWDADATTKEIALTSTAGDAVLLETKPELHAAAREHLCHERVALFRFVPGKHVIAYACSEGTVGTWDLAQNSTLPRARLEGHAGMLAVSSDGEHIIASGGSGTATIIDTQSGLVSTYRGHGFPLSALAAPNAEYHYFVTADARGSVRAWPLPRRVAHVVGTLDTGYHAAAVGSSSDDIAVTTWGVPTLAVLSPNAPTREAGPHEGLNIFVEHKANAPIFATYGYSDTVELWSSATMTRTHSFHTGQASITQLTFVDGSDDVITSGHDGRLVRWTPDGRGTLLASFDQAIERFVLLPPAGTIVVATADGSIWHTNATATPTLVSKSASRVNQLLASADNSSAYAALANGLVVSIETRTWTTTTVVRAERAVRAIAGTTTEPVIAVASTDGVIRVRAPGDGPPRWTEFSGRARQLTLDPTGILIAVCADGTVWLFSIRDHRSLCLQIGPVELATLSLTTDGRAAIVPDFEGNVFSIDLVAARELLAGVDLKAIRRQ